MKTELNQIIDQCLSSGKLTSAELEFVRSIDETMKMPSLRDMEILKRIWRKVTDTRKVA